MIFKLFVYYSWQKFFEWKSEAEAQSTREVKDTEMVSQAETSSPPQQTLAVQLETPGLGSSCSVHQGNRDLHL